MKDRLPIEFVCDSHCDTVLDILKKGRKLGKWSLEGHLDIPRMKAGGILVQVFAAYIEKEYKPDRSLQRAIQLIDCLIREINENQDNIYLVTNFKQLKSSLSDNRISAILSIEGGEALQGEICNLRMFYSLGVRMMTLTWNQRNEIADGSDYPESKRGLTCFGQSVVQEMNRLGMMIDVSHISESGFWDVLHHSYFPIIASHSNVYQLCSHPRNLKDEQIKGITDSGGLICVNYVPDFLINENRKATIEDVIRHINYLVNLAGIDSVGLGSDFDGCNELPVGLEGADKVLSLRKGLKKSGYHDDEIQKIMGKNFIRVFQQITASRHC